MKIGKQTYTADAVVLANAAVAGKLEGEGPYGKYFDIVIDDGYYGEKSWEKAEMKLQKEAAQLAMQKANIAAADVDMMVAGDLLNQCISSSFSVRDIGLPFYGLFGACSTMAMSMSIGALFISGGHMQHVLCGTSSHFCSAERQFRLPMEYGGQRTPTSQWTVTGSGMALLGRAGTGVHVTHVTAGKIIDKGIADVNNMGAAMAPAAADTIAAHLQDTGSQPSDYDIILTGDLGSVGHAIMCELLEADGYKTQNMRDCGVMIFEGNEQVKAGGSGCGCSAIMLCGYFLEEMKKGKFKKILFVGTGALMSPVSTGQGESIPSIAHAVSLCAE